MYHWIAWAYAQPAHLCSHSFRLALQGRCPFAPPLVIRYAVHKQLSRVLETKAQFFTTNQPVCMVILPGVYNLYVRIVGLLGRTHVGRD
jgi:hypothetical protein